MSTGASKSSERKADITDFIDQRRSGDFYRTADALSPDDRKILMVGCSFAEERVAPVINGYWGRAEFPFGLIPDYAALGIAGAGYSGYGCPGKNALFDGFVMKELARIDCSIATV